MANRITILLLDPGKPPAIREILNTLGCMQEVVGGYIEAVGAGPSLFLICNERGRLNNLPPNRNIKGKTIAGTFFLTRVDSRGEAVSLRKEDIAFLLKEYFPLDRLDNAFVC